MLNEAFCEFLEWEICRALEYSGNLETNGFWCDGVLLNEPDNAYSVKSVNDTRQVKLKAFIGKDGQTEYELNLTFGNKSLSRYARNLDIKVCIPNPESSDWFYIDTRLRKIEIQLF